MSYLTFNNGIMKHSGVVDGIFLVTAVAAFLLGGGNSQAQTRSIEGSWRGSGYLKPASGAREKVRCRVSYSKINNDLFSFSGTCASSAGSIRQTGQISRASRTRYIGSFNNSQYGVSGRIRVVVSGSRQTVFLTGGQGSGQLRLSKK